jgi:predicted nuclease with TOPRIM domain
MIDLSDKTQVDIVGLLGSLTYLMRLAKSGIDLSYIIDNYKELQQENKTLRGKLEDKQRHADHMKEYIKEIDGNVSHLERYLSEFLSLPSLKKIASLEDFTMNLKYIVDQYGTVRSVEKI